MKQNILLIILSVLLINTAQAFSPQNHLPQVNQVCQAFWSLDGIEGDGTKVSLYPNPANDYFMLKNAENVHTVLVYNILGREVKRFRLNQGGGRYQVNDLPKGMYVIRLINSNKDVLQTIRMNKR